MKKILLLTAAITAGAIFAAPVRAEEGEAPASPSAAPAQATAPAAPVETRAAPAAESKPVIPPDSEWVHPTK